MDRGFLKTNDPRIASGRSNRAKSCMTFDYTKLVRDIVEPRLAYHGFRYQPPADSDIPESGFFFVRDYWCKRQCIGIGRVEYSDEDLASLVEDPDLPTEVHHKSLGRQWLSNRYLEANVNSRYLIRDPVLFKSTSAEPLDGQFDPQSEALRKKFRAAWWEFSNEAELRECLKQIVEKIISEGLDYLEEEVADTRRFHAKLDERRMAEKARRSRDKECS